MVGKGQSTARLLKRAILSGRKDRNRGMEARLPIHLIKLGSSLLNSLMLKELLNMPFHLLQETYKMIFPNKIPERTLAPFSMRL
jgi:hypothetical protein